MPVIDTPCEVVKFIALWSVVYVWLPEKYASSDVAMLRRSDFSEARYAFSFVLANFGIAIAAKMPMITTTIRSSMRVKPLRLRSMNAPWVVGSASTRSRAEEMGVELGAPEGKEGASSVHAPISCNDKQLDSLAT